MIQFSKTRLHQYGENYELAIKATEHSVVRIELTADEMFDLAQDYARIACHPYVNNIGFIISGPYVNN